MWVVGLPEGGRTRHQGIFTNGLILFQTWGRCSLVPLGTLLSLHWCWIMFSIEVMNHTALLHHDPRKRDWGIQTISPQRNWEFFVGFFHTLYS